MKNLILVTVGSLSLSALAASPSTYRQVKTHLERTSKRELIVTLNDFLKAGAPSRMVGRPGHDQARDHLLATLKKFDPKNSGSVSTVEFEPALDEGRRFYQDDLHKKFEGQSKNSTEYQRWSGFVRKLAGLLDALKGTKGSHVVWEKQGLNPNKTLIITAHYDTITVDLQTLTIPEKEPMPGANYNASGVSVALLLVKALAAVDLNYSVRIVFLDWQAPGYLGSYQYARELKTSFSPPKSLLGILNLETLGQDTTFLDRTKKSGNMAVYLRNNPEEVAWIQRLLQHGTKVESKVSFEMKANDFDQSDTFRFWEQGLLAATFAQNFEDDFNPKFYQTAQDTPETLNMETLYGSYRFIGGVALGTLLDITK